LITPVKFLKKPVLKFLKGVLGLKGLIKLSLAQQVVQGSGPIDDSFKYFIFAQVRRT